MPEEHKHNEKTTTAHPANPVNTMDVFRALIDEEVQSGRLTPSRRRRIVRYAAAMGLTATEAGALIAQSRSRALKHPDPEIRRCAMRLIYPQPPLVPAGVKLALAVLVALALDILLVAAVLN